MALMMVNMLDGSVQVLNSKRVLNPTLQAYGTQFYLHRIVRSEKMKSTISYADFMAAFNKKSYSATITVDTVKINDLIVSLTQVLDVDRIMQCKTVSNGTLIYYINVERYKNKESIDKIIVSQTLQQIYDAAFMPSIADMTGYGTKLSAVHAGTLWELSIDDDYLYICVQAGTAGNAIWKRTSLIKH